MGYRTKGSFQSGYCGDNYSNIFRFDKNIHCTHRGAFKNIDITAIILPEGYTETLFIEGGENLSQGKVTATDLSKINYRDFFLDSNTCYDVLYYINRHNQLRPFEPTLAKIIENFQKVHPILEMYRTTPNNKENPLLFDDSILIEEIKSEKDFNKYFFSLSNIIVKNNDYYTCPLKTF